MGHGRSIGIALLAVLLAFAFLEPWLGGAHPAAQNLALALTPPGSEYLLGTDQFGRSMLARLAAALRLSLFVSGACVATAVVLGAGLGVLAAWHGGWTDRCLSVFVNLLLALPGLVLILLIAALAPGSLTMLYVAIALVLWIEYFRVARAVAARVVGSPAMEASKLLGFGAFYRFRRHVLPALIAPLSAQAAFGAATAVMALAALGFVSVGLKPPTAELGLMMVELFPYYRAAPWALLQPVLALSAVHSCFTPHRRSQSAVTATLEVRDLRVRVDTTVVVAAPRLSLQAGTPLTLMGETGAGKSLLLQAIMATLPAGLHADGQVMLDDEPLCDEERRALWGKRLALLPQEPMTALDPVMDVQAQISEVHRWVLGAQPAASNAAASNALKRVGLEQALKRLPGQLSGGMAQRLAYAAATAAGADILLADEPTKGLDNNNRTVVLDLLRAHAEQKTLLTVTHDLAVPKSLGGTLAVLRQGTIIEQGTVEQLLSAPQHPYTRELVASNRFSSGFGQRSAEKHGPIVSAKGLAVARGNRLLFEDVDLCLRPGEIVGLAGPSGVGKSSLGDAVLGLLPIHGGQIERAGGKRFGFQKLYQDPPAAFAPGIPLKTLLGELRALHKLSHKQLTALLDATAIDPSILERPADAVSGGELQRIALARVLLTEPNFLFADEPVSRLDPITARRVMDLLIGEARERQCGVLLVGHDGAQLKSLCDRVFRLEPPEDDRAQPARLVEA